MADEQKTNLWAWLCSEGRPPVPLGPTPRVTIGRSKDCDLVLKDPSVSLLQAEVLVDCETGALTFKDGESSSGSLVNGEEMSTGTLEFGDVLTFGSCEVRVQAVLAWLCSGPMAPVPLGADPAITIGRSKNCDVVIRDLGMSRKQGTIRIRGASMVFEDGGGSNGSYLNGRRVRGMASLFTGDVLTFGPYEVHLRSNDVMRSLGDELDDEGTVELTSLTTGLLDEVPLIQTLQELALSRKSGKLTILAGEANGTMTLIKGELLRADYGERRDVDAALAMLLLDEGRFVFAGGPDEDGEGGRTISTSVTSLLLQASRLRDERRAEAES